MNWKSLPIAYTHREITLYVWMLILLTMVFNQSSIWGLKYGTSFLTKTKFKNFFKSWSPNDRLCRLCKTYCTRRIHFIKHNNGIRWISNNNGNYFCKIMLLFQFLQFIFSYLYNVHSLLFVLDINYTCDKGKIYGHSFWTCIEAIIA